MLGLLFSIVRHVTNLHRPGVHKIPSSRYTAAADLFLLPQMLNLHFDKINSSPKQLIGEEYTPRSLLIFSHCKPE